VAAQFTALSQILFALTGWADTRTVLICISLGVIAKTAVGGQIAIIRTDALQFAFIFGGVAAACFFLYQGEGAVELLARVELLNTRFDAGNLLTLALLVGSAYFIGPDVFSRNLAAKDAATARRATVAAGLVLILFAVLLVFLALWVVEQGHGKTEQNPLLLLIRDYLPVPLAVLLGFGLLSALISSADTCLMSAASIVENDLLGGRSLKRVRLLVLLLGLLSLGIALVRTDIIALLITAYSVYVPGVVPPLFVAIMCYGRRALSKPIWLLAVCAGGACGMVGGWAQISYLPLVGMGLSGILALASVQSRGIQQ
jgi:SSS family solute:Na+ symporter